MADLWKYTRAQSDTDAETFFAACVTAGTTLSAGQKTAIYSLVGGLKRMSLWSKMTALYPFVGGTAGTHAINLKSPGTYNITWSGTVTHNSNGITGNGSTGYGDTGLNANTVLSLNSCHYSVYSRTSGTGTGIEIGAEDGTAGSNIRCLYTDSTQRVGIFGASSVNYTSPDGLGLKIASRTISSLLASFSRSRKFGFSANASVSKPNRNVFVCANNYLGAIDQPSSRNLSFASIGSGLSDQDAQNLSLLVQSYQSALGRAV